MAWQDFIKAIRQSDDDEKKRGGFFGQSVNVIDNVIDAGSSLTRGDFMGAIRQGGQAAESSWKRMPGSGLVADAAQGAARGVVNTYLSAKEVAEEDSSRDVIKRFEEIKKIPLEERNRLADQGKDPNNRDGRAWLFNKTREKNGGLDDETLDRRMAEIRAEIDGNKTYKAGNKVTKFLIGGEDDEVAASFQKTRKDAKKWLEGKGVEGGTNTALATAGAGVVGALDLPTGVGSIAKGVGKGGIKALAKEASSEGVVTILKSRIPSLSDDVVKELAPQLAKMTDEKVIAKTLEEFGTNITKGIFKQDPKNVIAGVKETIKDPSTLIPSLPKFGKNNKGVVDDAAETIPENPEDYGEASAELLKSFKYGSEIAKENKRRARDVVNDQLLDRNGALGRVVADVEDRRGVKLDTKDNPYELAILYNGIPDRVNQRVSELKDVLQQSPDLDAVKVIGVSRQIIDRGTDVTDANGKVIRKSIGSTISPDRARQAIAEQRARLGPELFDQAASVVDSVNKYQDEMFKELMDSGIITKEAMDKLDEVLAAQGNRNYFAKMNVLDYMVKSGDNQRAFGSSSFNTSKQSITKVLAEATGHKQGTELLDPIESITKGTDAAMRLIARNDIGKAMNRLADEAPDLIPRIQDPSDVLKSIDLRSEIKEIIPIRNKVDRLLSTQGRTVRQLESQINQLEKRGLNLSLKTGGERMDDSKFLVDGLGGRVPTSQAGKQVPTNPAEKRVMEFLGEVTPTNPTKMGPQDTGGFVRNLIEKGSRSDIDKLKRMVGTRDNKLSAVLDRIGELKTQFDEAADSISKNRDELADLKNTDVPEGYEVISFFDKGAQGKLAVPKEVASVFTGKNQAQRDYMTGLMGTVTGFVKNNLTTYNPAFTLVSNPIRDFKSFAYNAKNVGARPDQIIGAYLKGVATVFGNKGGDTYQRYIASGARSGFFADSRTGENMAKDLTREISGKKVLGVRINEVNNIKDFMREALRVGTRPLGAVADRYKSLAANIEDVPRVAQFQAALKAGDDDLAAAIKSRKVTVDFQKAGTTGQLLNIYVPFFNARLQGTTITAKALKENPARAAGVYAGVTAAPILAMAANNAQYPEVMKMIGDQERDNNFVIVLGDGKDEEGNFNQIVKIPKGDVDKILGNPLEQFARWMADDDPDNLAEVLTNMVGSILPADTVKDDKFNLSRTVGSTVLASPLVKVPAEAASNKNFYFDSDVVPQSLQGLPADEQVRKDDPLTAEKERETPKLAQFAAALAGTSPIKTENTLRSFGLGPLMKSPEDQIGDKLSGSSGNKMESEFYKISAEVEKEQNSASNRINQQLATGDYAGAQQTAKEYNALMAERFRPFARTYKSQLTPELEEQFSKKVISLTPRSIKQRQRNQLERRAAQ